ncbi:MAG: DUF1573 domain-containing protein [Bacteroidetes bacterium]|nr:DUF1573 domain-containing protein [Bacteroidota bacterium]
MKRLTILLCSIILIGGFESLHAQLKDPVISIDKLNHNFGIVKEEGGLVYHTFNFTNNGSDPLVINNVRSTCGCTVAEWTKEPIMPMGKGTVKVSFDPQNRPGAFRKSITVSSNASESNITLYIVGLVQARPKSIADKYPIRMDGVRFKSNHLSVTRVNTAEIKTDTLLVFNDSDMDKKITIPDAPEHLRFEIYPATLMPKQKGEIVVHYDAKKKNDWGFVMDKVYLHFNGLRYNNNLLAVSATIEEDFSNLSSEQLKKAPKMEFDSEAFNFGTIEQGEVIKNSFSFKNTGKQTLIIRKQTSTCGCTASEPSALEIPGGESGHLDVVFNSTGKIGKQFQTITLITNDPHKSTKLLRVIGTVKPKSK